MYDMTLREDVRWLALALCVLTKLTPEQAFQKLCPIPAPNGAVYTQDDLRDMVTLHKKGLTYREISRLYNINTATTYRRIKNFEGVAK